MKKTELAEIVDKLEGWDDTPDYEVISAVKNGDRWSLVIRNSNAEKIESEGKENE